MSIIVQIEAAMVSKSFLVMLMVFPRLEGEGDDGDRTGQEENQVESFFNQVHGVSVCCLDGWSVQVPAGVATVVSTQRIRNPTYILGARNQSVSGIHRSVDQPC